MSEAYVSWDVTEEEVYNCEGEVTGCNEYVMVEKIWVPAELRGNGLGRKMMAEALDEIEAKYPGMTIKLAALPFDGGMDMNSLVDFYESFGFEVEDAYGHAVIMAKQKIC